MNKIFSLAMLLLLGTYNVFAQEESTILTLGSDKLYSYEKVFEVPGKTKDEIFESIKTWVIKNIKTQANTNYFDEKDKSSISTVPAFPCAYNSWVEFKLNIEIKDGKYRLSAVSFMFHNLQGIAQNLGNYEGLSTNKKVRVKVMSDVDESFSKMLTSIQGSMSKKSDW